MSEKYETVIGLEVHVELRTESKIFCSCSTEFGAEPNTHVCPVCMGLPGTLPMLNERAVEYAVRAGIATGCSIAERTRFDRKNYFYPDLPKAYQISQYELPLCFGGGIDIKTDEGVKRIGITRIHLEEDAGKLIHDGERTLIDYNRCGVPLIEIVSEPDIRSAEEARAYLQELRTLLLYTGISDCRMDEGSLRCDVNLSVRRRGETALGVRTEIKNINSFAFAVRAIEYEAQRQINVIEAGENVVSETRRFDESSGKTYTMRLKESADDYRFFPEPDLMPLYVSAETVQRISAALPMLPAERRRMYAEKYGISDTDAAVITSRRELADYFEQAVSLTSHARVAANILLTDLLALVSQEGFDCPIPPQSLAEIATLYGEGTVNSSVVKRLIKAVAADPTVSARTLVESQNLAQIKDRTLLLDILTEVLTESPKLLSDYQSGKTAAQKAIIGKAMSKTQGLADPVILNELFTSYSSQ